MLWPKKMILDVIDCSLGEAGTWAVIWWPIVSGSLVPKIIKIRSSFFKLQSITSGMFFDVFVVHFKAYFMFSVFPR